MRRVGDLEALEARRADVEVELAAQATDARVRTPRRRATGAAHRPRGAGSRSAEGRRTNAPRGGCRRPRCDPAGQLGQIVNQEVGPPVGDDPAEVVEHRLDPHATEQARDKEASPVLGRDVAEARGSDRRPPTGDQHVRAQPGTPRTGARGHGRRTWIGRERHRVAGGLEGKRQRHHRVEVPESDDAGEDDSHAVRLLHDLATMDRWPEPAHDRPSPLRCSPPSSARRSTTPTGCSR